MNKFVSFLCKIFLKPIVDNFLIKEVRGLENIPKTNFILASNHQSHLDWIISGYLSVPRGFTYLGQIDRYTGLLGFGRNLLYFIAGVIPVDRKDENSKKRAIEKAMEDLKRGVILVIYPEGTRTRTGKIGKGKFGVAKIYLRTGVPILPAGIKGTFELMPTGKGFPEIKKIIEINIGSPLYFKEEFEKAKNLDCNSQEYKNLLQKITDKTMEEIIRLKSELYQNSVLP